MQHDRRLTQSTQSTATLPQKVLNLMNKKVRKSHWLVGVSPLALAACGGGAGETPIASDETETPVTDVSNPTGSEGAGETPIASDETETPVTDVSNPTGSEVDRPNAFLNVFDQTLFSVQVLGEDAAILDLNQDGSKELIVFTSSTRSQYSPEQNDIAIFELNDDYKILGKNYQISPFFDSFDASKITAIESNFTSIDGTFTIGWLQDAEVADFNGDGIDDLFFAGHGRELGAGETNFSDTNPQSWPGDYIRVAISNNIEIEIVTINETPAFWHGADIGDIDGDGDIDVVAVISAGPDVGFRAKAWANNGLAEFTTVNLPDTIQMTPSTYWETYSSNDFFVSSVVSVGNVTDAVAEDIVVGRIKNIGTSSTELLKIYTWDGVSFENTVDYIPVLQSLELITGQSYDVENLQADKITIEDIDGDADDDIAVKLLYDDEYLATMVLENIDGASFNESYVAVNINQGDAFRGGDGPSLVDVNQDGLLDVVNAGWIGATFWPDFVKNVWINTGDFNFASLENYIDTDLIPNRTNEAGPGNVQFNVVDDGDQTLFVVRGGYAYDQEIEANLHEIRIVGLQNLELLEFDSQVI